jgi:hypothetical protein
MEEPTPSQEENQNVEGQTAPASINEPAQTNDNTPAESGEQKPAGEAFTPFTPNEEATTTGSETSEPVSSVAPSVDEPVKAEEPAVEAAATPSTAEPSAASGFGTVSSQADTPGPEPSQPGPSALAIDNPHPMQPVAKHGLPVLVIAIICVLLGGGGGFVAAAMLKKEAPKASQQAPVAVVKELKVPADATVINECAKGRGKQYVLPKDIPQGPVYNVYNGKVIGIEFMLSQKDVLANKDYLNLLLEGVTYDHLNVGLLSKGHSGYPEPHYHVDVFTISHDEASKITCT